MSHVGMSLDRRTLLKASAVGVGGLAATAAAPSVLLPAASAGPPPTPSFGPEIDGYARYEGQTQCIGVEQPGVAAFRDMVVAAYPGTRNISILRACGIGGTSEHKEGRAWDWGVYATRPDEAAAAQDLINWLLATDRHGNRHANARRLGLMYMIWNRRSWSAWRPDSWQTYTGSNPHTDHVHFSFDWAGARQQTSFWGASTQEERFWSGWTPTASSIDSAPVADSWSTRKTDVFSTSSSGTLRHRYMVSGQGWGPGDGWRDLGAPPGLRLTSQPAVTARAEGLLNVFAVASDRAMWHLYYTPQGGWSSWGRLGGRCRSAPGATSWGADHLIVSTLGANGTVYERSYDGRRWLPWRTIPGGRLTTAPALASWGRGRIDVVGRGTAGDLVHNVYETGRGWRGFVSRGGVLANATPAAVSMDHGRLDVFVIAYNEAIYRKTWQDRWDPPGAGWERFGTPGGGALSGIGATSLNSAHLEVFARGRDGRLHQRWYA